MLHSVGKIFCGWKIFVGGKFCDIRVNHKITKIGTHENNPLYGSSKYVIVLVLASSLNQALLHEHQSLEMELDFS